MARRNPLEKALDHITDDFKKRLSSAKSTNTVTLGKEEVTPREFRSRFADMSEKQRQQVLDESGQEEVLKQLRGGRDDDTKVA